MADESTSLPPILPVGTQVVTRSDVMSHGEMVRPRGAMGIIVASPVDADHAYRVRFPGGEEATLHRHEVDVLSHHASGVDVARQHADLEQYIIYRAVVGSRAYGLSRETSDVDRRGFYLPPAERHWSLFGVPPQLDLGHDDVYWELQKFLMLALKGNPNVLEVLYTPLVERATELALELRSMRDIFLSKLIYQTYNGYAMSQFGKLQRDLRQHGSIKPKHAMHLVRLLLSGIAALREGRIVVEATEHRDALLAIRDGAMPWEEINAWRLTLHKTFDEAFAKTTLPDRPDYVAANAFLIKARRTMVG